MARHRQRGEVFTRAAGGPLEDFDLAAFLQRLSVRSIHMLHVTSAGFLLLDANGKCGTVTASDDVTRRLELFVQESAQSPGVDCCLSGRAMTDIDLRATDTAARWPRFTVRARGAGFVMAHAVPLRRHEITVGALSLYSDRAVPLGAEATELARALADMAALIVLQQHSLERSRAERTRLRTDLASRIVIEQAKGILAERRRISTDEAFTALCSYARSRGLPLPDVARQVVDGEADSALTGEWPAP
ncbi:GAF and ANTAR domain-containing protein [Streptomyces sp. MST-110588]|uniref:ANTAR domain-containing protein n=1 Tax=Streptomyces sp. MST-110588 TaxID=2833628 RepID=UPI001F5DE21E|nr:GAF and ANTAR domain-containing protein [Streptomyces sp. MST-110588]UNO39982.1 GAF and ANTAR domain-containing protein [Streptomyces sp. MST-110588]